MGKKNPHGRGWKRARTRVLGKEGGKRREEGGEGREEDKEGIKDEDEKEEGWHG